MNSYVNEVLEGLKKKAPWENLFIQAATEILNSLVPVLEKEPKYKKNAILERLIEPERIIAFRVPWVDDKGVIRVNNAWRVQFSSAIGPYKGGIRFHPNVNLDTLKFLGFEQIFKNSLTGLPMGGGKGGANFDTSGKSDAEIMRFCQSFMGELWRHIGSLIRPEATGYGVVYFAEEMLKAKGDSMKGKKVAISGFGNVSWGAALKATELGAKVVTISGPDGYIFDADGISGEKIAYLDEMLRTNRDSVAPFATKFKSAKFFAGKRPWEQVVDVALPCAIQNELNLEEAKGLLKNGCMAVVEGSNMSSTLEAVEFFQANCDKILYAPGKASNAGGVATSGLEMSQNSMRLGWTSAEVDQRLHQIMINIHKACVDAAKRFGTPGNYVNGANIAGFIKVADSMLDQGLV